MVFRMEDLNKITHVRLDRENLVHLSGLEFFSPNVTHLYLQHVSFINFDSYSKMYISLIILTSAVDHI